MEDMVRFMNEKWNHRGHRAKKASPKGKDKEKGTTDPQGKPEGQGCRERIYDLRIERVTGLVLHRRIRLWRKPAKL